MTTRDVTMPDLGEGLTESDLVEWHVAEGDTVELNQVIADVETAKALVQLPSPYAGVISRLLVGPGTTVPVGSVILSIREAGAEPEDATTTDAEESAGHGAAAGADETPARTAVLVGYGPPVEGSARPRRKARSSAWSGGASRDDATADVTNGTAGVTNGRATSEASAAPSTRERPRSFPPVRKLAHELGVDLTSLTGTGEDGLITRDDVLARATRAARPAGTPSDVSTARPRATSGDREVRTPITGVRKHTAAAMVASAFTAPHATEFLTVDVTPTMELLASLSTERAFAGHRLTVLTMVAKAMTVAIARTPSVNSRWDEEAREIVQFGYVNLGIAAATPRGLLVPHIKDADRLRLPDLADAIARLTEEARAGTTAPADLTGGTISVTNIGVFGIDAGTPILNPGEAAILAVGAFRRRPWEHRDEIALRSVMTLSLSFDHRLVDGEQGSRFLADVGAMLAAPGRTLAML